MEAPAEEKLCAIRKKVADRIGPQRFQTWFGDRTTLEVEQGNLQVAVQNSFAGTWIQTNYLDALHDAARDVLGSGCEVGIRIMDATRRHSDAAPPARSPVNAAGGVGPARDAARPERTWRDLSAFVVGPSNALAFSAISAVADSLATAFKPLVLYSECGLGKTHLLQGLCHAVQRNRPTWVWRYISGEEFTNSFVSALRHNKLDAFRERHRKVDLLVIDDIHFLADKKATQEEFLHTFNAIEGSGKQVVLSSDVHPRSISKMGDPIISRLLAGMVVKIGPPEFRTRREILVRRAGLMHVTIPDDVLDHMARNIMRNVRELEGALYKLAAVASLAREGITVGMAQAVLEEYLIRTQQPSASAEIEAVVAGRFGVTREQIHSSCRGRTICLARSIAMYLARKHSNLSYPEIGRCMGSKNHSTVINACKRTEADLSRGAVVSWETSSGREEALLSDLIAGLERSLAQRRA